MSIQSIAFLKHKCSPLRACTSCAHVCYVCYTCYVCYMCTRVLHAVICTLQYCPYQVSNFWPWQTCVVCKLLLIPVCTAHTSFYCSNQVVLLITALLLTALALTSIPTCLNARTTALKASRCIILSVAEHTAASAVAGSRAGPHIDLKFFRIATA